MMTAAALHGNAYSQIVRDPSGRVTGLWPIHPSRVTPERHQGKIRYRVSVGSDYKYVAAADMLHIPALGFDGLIGLSPIRMARQAIGLSMAAEKFGARFFGSGTNLGGILKHPSNLSKPAQERLKAQIESRHQGGDKSHGIMILEEDMELQNITIPPEDSQFIETRKFQVSEIARIFRVPPHMIGDLERATFSNIEHQSIQFVQHTIRPWLVRWEQALKMRLLGGDLYAEFNVEGLLRGDTKSRYEAYSIARQNGWMSANDILRMENMNPIPGGDTYLQPLNMEPVGEKQEAGERSAQVWEERKLDERTRLGESFIPVVENFLSRTLKEEAAAIREGGDVETFYTGLYEKLVPEAQKVFLPLARGIDAIIANEIGNVREEDLFDLADLLALEWARQFVARHIGVSRQQIETAGDDQKALEELAVEWEEKRPLKVAKDEAMKAENFMVEESYYRHGVRVLRWVTRGRACSYCRGLSGRTKEIKTNWFNEGEEFQPEGADRPMRFQRGLPHPPLHRGCVCTVTRG